MGFDVFEITLEPHAPVYFSGQQVQGYVTARTSTQISCRAITLTLKGKGKVEWTERRNKRTHTYSNSEVYAELRSVLWHGSDSNEKLEPGNHVFPFSFVLQFQLPTSFETTYGSVRHYLKASADIPWGLDTVKKLLINVHNIYDLNLDRRSARPLRFHGEKTSSFCCCCKVGPVSFDLSIPRMGYVPGEVMYIDGTIYNNSFSEVKYTEAKLIQKVVLRATSKIKEQAVTVQRVYRPSIKQGGRDVWYHVPLHIPAVTPSILEHCNIINVSYILKIVAKIGCCKSASVTSEIIIGSVALQPSQHLGRIEMQQLAQNVGPTLPVPSAPVVQNEVVHDDPPSYPESEPPPTYDELVNKGAIGWGKSEHVPKHFEK
ncbi:arrestin domain-containing protein 3-like [Macrobrachium rosenbergii]|uniref:arrestin domain-containing protein 3-like n=1 Tax=Macrobrachium rosenbergii TaxID=79674 RepID=UPI0034D57175